MSEATMTRMTDSASEATDIISGGSPPRSSRSSLRFLTDPTSVVPVYLGVLIAVAGFVFLVVGWSSVAGTIDVGRQLPYLMSAGLPGIGLVMVGLVVVSIGVRRQDSAERARQMSALTEALRSLQSSFDQ